jgi:hypothetical protein
MTPEVAEAVENAYRVFARYDLRGGVSVCRCNVCVAPECERKLNTIPLRQISSGLLAEYTSSAHGFDGKTENDLRYYLPRYFELIAAGDPPTTLDEQICLQRLQEADYPRNWGPQESGAVDRFLVELLRERLATPFAIDAMGWSGFGEDKAEAVLCMAAYAGAEMSPLLKAWSADDTRSASLHLANMIATADWRRRHLRDSWWLGREHTEAAMRQVFQWLSQLSTWERLEAALFAEKDEGAAALLSQAQSIVANLM